MKTERARFDIKLYELTSSEEITLDFLVYCGRGMFYNYNKHSDLPTIERIPASFLTPFLNKGHILFTDNFYASPLSATFFLENGTHLCETVSTNGWYYSKEISNENLEKCTAAFYNADHNECIIACKYRSRKIKQTTFKRLFPCCGHAITQPWLRLAKVIMKATWSWNLQWYHLTTHIWLVLTTSTSNSTTFSRWESHMNGTQN